MTFAGGFMAITLVRKGQSVKIGLPKERELSSEALEAVGLASPPKAPSVVTEFPLGSRVRVTNDLFPWIKHYKPGDTGIVTRIIRASLHPPAKSPKDDLYDIELDLIRVPGQRLALIQFWELELVEAKPAPRPHLPHYKE
jgi:hypothetical protein